MREYSAILGPVDSAFYYVERPETPMNIGALTIFDGMINFDDLVDHIDTRLHQIPRYRDRVVQAPFNLGQPTWIPDPDFYIGNHIKCARVSPPGTETDLRKLVGELLSETLDRSRPLWEIYVIEGLPDQTALFFKVHHCMVDGLAAVELFSFLMDFSQEYASRRDKPKPLFDPLMLPDPVELTIDSVIRDVSHQFGLLRKLGKETLRMGNVLTDREKRLKMLLAVAHLINNNLQPIKKLPINGKNIGLQSMVWAEFPLEEIHAIRALCGASVNEVMLALLTKAVERYTAANGGSDQPFLRVLVPFNIRDDNEKGDYGNRISVLPVDVPFKIADPLEHLKAAVRFSKVMKESSLAFSMDLILTLPSLLPSMVHLPVWNLAPVAFSLLAHTWCTNVAAMPIPTYLLGHELKHVYGFFPLNPSMGLASVIVSYNGLITMSLIADQGIVRDVSALERYLKDAYVELAACLPEKKPSEIINIKTNGFSNAIPIPVANADSAAERVKYNGNPPEAETASLPANPAPVAVEPQPPPAPILTPQPPPPPLTSQPHRLFSEGWAKALQEAINHSEAYRSASTHWTAGSLAFVMEVAPDHGFEVPAAVWFDLYRGVCRSARALSAPEALRESAFVIQGDYPAWMEVLSGRASPLGMLTTGRLKLRKGALLRLLPQTRSAGELVRCAQRVPWTSERLPQM